jgi:hypothetical protein
VVPVVTMPTPFARGVRTVFELLDCLAEGRIGVLSHVELDSGGATVFHDVSHNVVVLIKRSGVGLTENVVCVEYRRASSRGLTSGHPRCVLCEICTSSALLCGVHTQRRN